MESVAVRLLPLLALVGVAPFCASAQAPGRTVSADKVWEVVTTREGCRAVLANELELAWGPDPNARFSWTGGCNANGLITGDNAKLITEFTNQGTRFRIERTVSAAAGMLTGRSSEATYSDADDFDPKTPAGSFQLHDFGDVRNPMPGFFKDGCSYEVDRNGAPNMQEPSFSDCKAADGIAMRSKLMGGGAPAAGKTVSAPIASTAPTPKAGGDKTFESNLKTFAADQLLALVSTYIQTGQVDLAGQARAALVSRFPNSPLAPIAAQLIASAMQPAATKPVVAPAPASAPALAPAPAASIGGAIDGARLRQMTDAMGYSSRVLNSPGDPLNFEITKKVGTTDVPIAFIVSGNGKFVWLSVLVGPVPAAKASAALAKVASIQPTMIWQTDRGMYFGAAIDNRGIDAEVLKSTIDRLADDVAKATDIWGQ